ncbi:MAG: bifunctional diaminohydroxyphosphoribosylaminopyrimidine deaminase/5-amino-6-(5-phosphoribosylamino)uracil reductase RibD [Planctomycetales bacterium]|nr:bifunctional diaminohydroxyphosphoribosylaminopyrimidine deaminase/5-amino-6-(5-phosphoribosylamino)uracil reductase RibD [Planctomycetales bacterium]
MRRALELAERGRGAVEPNPMVGCVLVRDGACLGEGWHREYGGPHAEVHALAAAGEARGATAYVTLEPCSHHGKTPPCADALIRAGVARVVVAMQDPFPEVAGQGIAGLRDAGIDVEAGLLQREAEQLNAPYLTRLGRRRPWVIAKWAMTLDGRIASRTGNSRWVSGPQSRERVHALRGRMDAIMVGSGTVLADDPLLTCRPEEAGGAPCPRRPRRVVCDRRLRTPIHSQLAATANETPVLIATSAISSRSEAADELRRAGCEVWPATYSHDTFLQELLTDLALQGATNLLVEGGAELLGAMLDAELIDEVWAFVCPKLIGGAAPGPILGQGRELMSEALALRDVQWERIGDDLLIRARCHYNAFQKLPDRQSD